MPTSLLGEPPTVEKAQGGISTTKPLVQTKQPAPQGISEGNGCERLSRRRIGIQLRRVFEGHEEFLGWTPD